MNDMKNTLISAGVAVVVVILGLAFFAPKPNVITQVLGGQSVAVTDGNCYAFMGVNVCPNRVKMNLATTTVCAIKSPAATSTLVRASASFSVSSTTASIVAMTKSATAFATTTLIGGGALAANAQGTFNATTTLTTETSLDGTRVFGPSQYLVVGMQGGVGTFSPTGWCNATFEVN